jgi:hypothetical protein
MHGFVSGVMSVTPNVIPATVETAVTFLTPLTSGHLVIASDCARAKEDLYRYFYSPLSADNKILVTVSKVGGPYRV